MLLQKIGENQEYKFYSPGGKEIDRFGISKALNPPDYIKIPITLEGANITYDKTSKSLDINPDKNHTIMILEADEFGYPNVIVGVCYPNCTLPFIDYDRKKIEIINYCDKPIPIFAFTLNDFAYHIDFNRFIKTETPSKVLADWRKKKVTVLTPVTSHGYTFKGEIDGHGKSIVVYSSPKRLGADKDFIEGFKKFLEANGLELREEGNEAIIYDPLYHNEYKAISPHLNLLQMLARYGMVLFPCDTLPSGVLT